MKINTEPGRPIGFRPTSNFGGHPIGWRFWIGHLCVIRNPGFMGGITVVWTKDKRQESSDADA
jgi:hypothetical protein